MENIILIALAILVWMLASMVRAIERGDDCGPDVARQRQAIQRKIRERRQ